MREASSVSSVMFAELVVSTAISHPPCSENQPFMTGITSFHATESQAEHRARLGNTDERNHEVINPQNHSSGVVTCPVNWLFSNWGTL